MSNGLRLEMLLLSTMKPAETGEWFGLIQGSCLVNYASSENLNTIQAFVNESGILS